MQNPWVHDDVPESAETVHRSRAKLLAVLLWGTLVVAVAAALFLTGEGPTDPGVIGSAWTAFMYGFGALLSLLFLPLFLKLLAISRTVASLVFLGVVAVVARVVVAESDRLETAIDEAASAVEPIGELAEVLTVLFVTLVRLPW